jgi:hypothetical protein
MQIVALALGSGDKPWLMKRAICSSFRRHAARCRLSKLSPKTALQQAAIPKPQGRQLLMLRFRLGAKKI